MIGYIIQYREWYQPIIITKSYQCDDNYYFYEFLITFTYEELMPKDLLLKHGKLITNIFRIED